MELEPGKLFIVGDPKQSIYAFRRADIEAFERVVEKIRAGGGAVYSLVTNFRSDGAVLDVVNNVFDRLFQPTEHVQPANEPLAAKPQRKPEVSVSGAQLRLVTRGRGRRGIRCAGCNQSGGGSAGALAEGGAASRHDGHGS